MRIDLQLHSTYSDGYLAPRELVDFIHGHGVKVAALTDHNTVAGLAEFRQACLKRGIRPIVGMELYVKLRSRKFNLLWFNFDEKSPELHELLRNTQVRRKARIRTILKKLNGRGFRIDINKILDRYNHYVAINHLVDDILKNPFNRKKIQRELHSKKPREEEIITAYFYNPEIGRLFETYVNIERIVRLRKKIGGQLILNHPGKYNQLQKNFLSSLKKLGLDGMEVLSPHHSIGAVMYAQFMAEELGFMMTGGSDFHKFEGNQPIRDSLDYFQIDSAHLKGIEEVIG